MIPGSQALMLSIFPHSRRATALGIWSITTLVAPICGPILGGYISDNWHWGWIFLINVPVGVVAGFVCWSMLSRRETPVRRLPVDTVGLALLIVWAGSLQVVLDTGKNAGWWDSPHIVALSIVAAIGFAAFLIWELTEEHPIVDLSLFRNRNFALGTVVFCLGNGVFFANMILMPLWLQTQLGYTATWAGLVSAPTGMVAVLLTPIAAGLMARTDARLVASIAFGAAAASYFLRAGLTNDASFIAIALPLMVQGIASASFFIAVVMIILDGMPQARIPDASGLANFVRIIASGFAASLVTTLWDNREALHQSRLADATSTYAPQFNAALAALQRLGFEDLSAKAAMTRDMVRQAYLLASLDLFSLSAWLCMGLIVLVWLCRRPHGGAAMPASD
jgi:DHA2 family multidrug resistance protein